MLNGLRRIFGQSPSKENAKNRLQMLLVQDRGEMSSEELDNFKSDLLGVLQKYFLLDQETLSIEWKRMGDSTEMLINTPISGRPKRPEAANG